MKKLFLYSIPRSIKQYEEGNKIDEQPCFVNLGAAGKPEDLIQVKHRDTGMVIAPGDDDYDSDEEFRPELEDGKVCFLSFCVWCCSSDLGPIHVGHQDEAGAVSEVAGNAEEL